MATSGDLLEVAGCLVFSVEALCFLIFKRLPVKSLCRFRCVCRSWNSLITSPSFVAEHFSLVASATEKSYLLLNGVDDYGHLFALYHPHESPQNQVTYLDHPFQAKQLCIVDVIRGVVCLHPVFANPEENAILWNPSTRKYLSIPWSHSGPRNYHHSIGFGYQSSKDDFKVVTASYHPRDLGPLVCEVFSLKSGFWMTVASDSTVGSYARISGSVCFLNGTIHWIASLASAQEGGNGTFSLLCFDCEHDKLSKMELPQEFIHSPPIWVHRYGGKLSVYNGSFIGLGDRALEMWVMDKYGVVSTWNKLFRVENGVSFRSIVMHGEDGDILVYDDVLALAEETKKRLGDRKLYMPVLASVFEESLYSLEQTSQIPNQ